MLTLSELPEPPIPVSEIGPIPPPPMFSSPSPTVRRFNQPSHHATPMDTSSSTSYDGKKIRLRVRVLFECFFSSIIYLWTHFLSVYGIFPLFSSFIWPPPPSPWLFLRSSLPIKGVSGLLEPTLNELLFRIYVRSNRFTLILRGVVCFCCSIGTLLSYVNMA